MTDTIVYTLLHLSSVKEVLLKVSILLLLGWMISVGMERCSANPRWRVMLWRGVAAGCFLIPLLISVAPKITIPISPERIEAAEAQRTMRELAMEDFAASVLPAYSSGDDLNLKLITESDIAETRSRAFSHVGDQAAENPAATRPSTVASAPPSFSWKQMIFAFYFAGMIFLTFRFLLRQLLVRSNLKSALLSPSAITACAKETATLLGIRRPPVVRTSADVASPYLTGILHPTIVLSQRVARAENRKELQSVLAHELAHLRGADVPWSVMMELLSIVLWFHPLAWRIPAAHSAACEETADALAADCMGGQRIYSAVLARVALDVLTGPGALRGTIPMARMPEIRKRLQKLKSMKGNGAMRKALVLPAVSLFFGALALIACAKVVKAEDDQSNGSHSVPHSAAVEPAAPTPAIPPIPVLPPDSPTPPGNAKAIRSFKLGYRVKVNEAFDTEEAANALLHEFVEEGYLADVTKKGDNKWYVYVGRELEKEKAKALADTVEEQKGTPADVVSEEENFSNEPFAIDLKDMNLNINPGDFKYMTRPTRAWAPNTLRAAVFTLEPTSVGLDTEAKKEAFVAQVREVIDTLLYAEGGKEKADKEGRKSWYDAASHRITITAYTAQIDAVQEYLQRLPELKDAPGIGASADTSFRAYDEQMAAHVKETIARANKRAAEAAKRASDVASRVQQAHVMPSEESIKRLQQEALKRAQENIEHQKQIIMERRASMEGAGSALSGSPYAESPDPLAQPPVH
ncbi:MAG: M56 family metallopeptidase [Candidatus Sumerlaeota bacterium]